MTRSILPCVVGMALLFGALSCDKKPSSTNEGTPPAPPPAATPTGPLYDPAQLVVFSPLPATLDHPSNPPTEEKVALGRALFFDSRLSAGRDVSCSSCHDVSKGGDDGKPTSTGTKDTKTRRNAPTLFNAAGAHAQGWDARATTVEEMIAMHAVEAETLGGDEKRLLATIAAIPTHAAAFQKAFPAEKTAISTDTFAKAVGAYVRKLVTRSRWDQFLAGDDAALTDDEKRGVGAFMNAGCTTCHAGKYVGAAQNQKLGVAKPWPKPAGDDPGRFEVTKQEVDRGMFKVPSLRNVTRTGPWLHDGSITSLDEMVRLMSRHQTGREVSDAQAKSILAFLGALAGEPPKDLISSPDGGLSPRAQ